MFAAVCVLLTSLGHVMMSGTAVPWWALVAGALVTGGAAWRLGGRERGPLLVGSATVAAQAVLHTSFSLAQAIAQPDSVGGGTLVQRWTDHLPGAAHTGPGTAPDPMATSMDSLGHMGHMNHMGHADHVGVAHALRDGISGSPGIPEMSSVGMLAVHLLAALACGLWLACGERAAFRILRALAGWLTAPLHLILRVFAPPSHPQLRVRRDRSDRAPHRFLLAYAITSRGPPVGTAVA
ncbi:hypothetical protein [Streptomyces phaeolivaceus]|uniref:hypothetical protein n=1 Tax=Streptomyces phaeolivaceus TaxID=2653200 RepID=UPI00299F8B24|nr:hypothetical protein [Streptomyces phaeolivaceus]